MIIFRGLKDARNMHWRKSVQWCNWRWYGCLQGFNLYAATTTDICRGCMEGVAYEMYLNHKALNFSGTSIKKLHATGGGAYSKVWMQMKADVLNIPITALKTVDSGTVGSAILTGIALGCFKDLREAAEVMVEETRTYLPQVDMHQQYMKVYQRYEKTIPGSTAVGHK